MRLGVILGAQTDPERTRTLGELDAWIAVAGRVPDLAPVWSRGIGPSGERWPVDRHLLAGIRRRGIIPVIYAESTGVPYRDILGGLRDMDLRLLGSRAAGLGVRWDQEPDGDGLGADWQTRDARALYAETFAYVEAILRDEGDCRLIWSPVFPERAASMGLFPGPEHVGIMGFTRFSRLPSGKLPPDQWRRSAAESRALAPGRPVWVTETGRIAGLPRRSKWLVTVPDADVDAAVIFDMLIGAPHADDWRWSASMYRTWAALP